jgi:S1-C subfamily serine protease
MVLNDIILTATLVLQLKAGAVIGYASGFFYEKGDGLYLVTNQHVVKGNDGPAPDTLRLRLHVDAKDISKNDIFEVPLYADGKPVWKIHPQQRDADIAVVRLDRAQLKSRFIVRAWSSDRFLPQKYVLQPGEDVFIMGYPLGFHDQPHNLPIFRDARRSRAALGDI